MKSLFVCLLLVFGAFGLTGCVSQGELDRQRQIARTAQERVIELEHLLEEKQAQIDLLTAGRGSDADWAARLAAAEAEADQLRAELAAASAALAELAASGGRLDPQLVSALEDLAAKYPGLMTFDANRKMILLQSDLTFDLGKTSVKPAAAQSLASLAGVLKSPDASAFEIRVVGHTDNVPITNPTNKKKFETNWGLSAFRAISVMDVLAKSGVSQNRMSIAGYGQTQPVVANPAKGGAQANRRVEIFLVPPYATTPPTPAATPVAPTPAASTPADPAPATPEGPEAFK